MRFFSWPFIHCICLLLFSVLCLVIVCFQDFFVNHWASQVDLFLKSHFQNWEKNYVRQNRDVLYTAETKETETLRDIFACHFDPTIPVFCFCSRRLSAHLSIRCSSFSLLIILPFFFFFFSVEILVKMLMIVISYSTSALVISSMSRLCLSSLKKIISFTTFWFFCGVCCVTVFDVSVCLRNSCCWDPSCSIPSHFWLQSPD